MSTNKISYLKNQKIYLICNGTSTNQIIHSINENAKSKNSFFSLFKKNNLKLKNDEFPYLENIGIKESHLCKEANNDLFINILNNPFIIGTSLDYNSIETSIILFNNIPNTIITPLGYTSNETEIRNKSIFEIFKKKFGEEITETMTNVKKYWKNKNIENEFLNIKNVSSKINWSYIPNNTSSYSSYNFSFVKKELEKIILNKYKKISTIYPDIDSSIFVFNSKLIYDILKSCKELRFNKKYNTIETTSIWEINIDIEFHNDLHNNIIKKNIIYKKYKKIYPTEFEHNSLKYTNDKYIYKYQDHKYLLFNSMEKIPIKYIKNMNFRINNNEKQIFMKKINTNINKHLENNDDLSQPISSNFIYENLK